MRRGVALTGALLITWLAMQAAVPAAGGPWIEVGEELGARYFVDPTRLRRDGDRIFFPVRLDVNPPQNGVTTAEANYVIDCRRRTYRMVSVTLRGADAGVLGSRRGDARGAVAEPFDESMIETQMMRRLCGAGSR